MTGTPVSSMVWVMGGGVIGSLGAVGLKAGANRLKPNLTAILTNWPLFGGIVAYLISSVFFVKGIKEGQLSVLYPIVALGQVWTMAWARMFFKEHITKPKVIAVMLILVGVALIGYGNSQLSIQHEAAHVPVSGSQTKR
jgi:multidrug transporter EmrE-like cation transporter